MAIAAEAGEALVWQVDQGEFPSGPVDVVIDASVAEAVEEHKRLLYVSMGAKDIADAMVEHQVAYDPRVMQAEKEKVRAIRQALQDPTRPVPDCPVAGKGQYGECTCVEVAMLWARGGR